jgi:hypothetical protein
VPFFPKAFAPTLRRRIVYAMLSWAMVVVARAADIQAVAGPGATKEEVINAYGWPSGQSHLGNKEVLNYPQGSITLTNGRVERVEFSTRVPWPAPKARPGSPAPAVKKAAETKTFDPWTSSFNEAVTQAGKQHARILAAFVGSDWSPPSKRFLDEVSTHPEFVNEFMGDFVFLKLDFPARLAMPAELKKQNDDLRARCGVTTYPALMVISNLGEPVAVIDLNRETGGDNYLSRVISAVGEVRLLLKQKPAENPKPAAAAPAVVTNRPVAPAPPNPENVWSENFVKNLAASAGWALAIGLGGGTLLAIVMVVWMWRSRVENYAAKAPRPEIQQPRFRLKDVPTLGELRTLSAEQLRVLVAALFEANGYTAQMRHGDADADIELRRRGHTKTNVLVCCRTADRGVVGAKQVRDFFGSIVASGVESGWFVSAGEFAPEAQSIADERGIELIDGSGLIERLRQLPTVELGEVLTRAGT